MKTAFVFPGQGSQSIGMLNSWVDNKIVNETMSLASDTLNQDIKKIIHEGPIDNLNLTLNTQPIMLAVGFAFFSAWCNAGGKLPSIMSGHSLGEYTALVAAEAISFPDALRLVRFRAEAMQSVIPIGVGLMAAVIGLNVDVIIDICKLNTTNDSVVEVVNFNSPNQVVIAGNKAAVLKLSEELKKHGAKKVIILPVSAPFHSSLLKPVYEILLDFLDNIEIRTPKIDVINNVDVKIYRDPSYIREALARQSCNPVRWIEIIKEMSNMGIKNVIECGPGVVLSGLTKRIDSSLFSKSINNPDSLQDVLNYLN
ncbi:[acyl-carrier-protein] S-malonyltransferase [Candidatus Kinetoplastibacterium desouzaii TCC079E]|uniref:Malonyl CoA-acyl carrier protein transacylase n=1 Tax=Candidatus Kinetoplastidibacterium desouzai TCC079E TaxID=1208919 RepID=M1LMR0_9PROT|nr:ACP S-malonyltransferase [Candidatus Kinetoplastibacterium desouzaii]AGF47012.1 [acyl-carrier-protein] S-malonyltransferase [Candidatus Kinetoplastibacterium desouzaii TCC079E]